MWRLLVLLVVAGCSRPAAPDTRPNVLVLVADDLTSRAVESFGGLPGYTPNLDRLAGRGARFRRAMVSSPICTPSRQSFLTGRWPHAIGVSQLRSLLDPKSTTLGTVFRDAGYATAAIGKMHWNQRHLPGQDFGFDRYVGRGAWLAQLTPEERAAWDAFEEIWAGRFDSRRSRLNVDGVPLDIPEPRQRASFYVDRTIEFLDERRDRPFLAFCSFDEVHAPFAFPPSYAERVKPSDVVPPEIDLDELRHNVPGLHAVLVEQFERFGPLTEEELRGFLASYLRSVAWLDFQIGRLLDHLEASGLAENTIVVFWSDHGFFLGEHGLSGKNYFYHEVVETPLVLVGPGIPAGEHDALAQMLDVFPTLCELTGVPPPPKLDGRSLVPLLRNDAPVRDYAFCELQGLFALVRDERWKLVLGSAGEKGLDQLYDLRADPAEKKNLIRDAGRRAVKERLLGVMHDVYRDSPPDWMPLRRWQRIQAPQEFVRWAITRVKPGTPEQVALQEQDEDD